MSDSDPREIPIEHSLDLHTFAARDIPSVVDEYIRAAHEAGLREVRLIHGRGKGVQRGIEPDYVVALSLDENGRISGTITQFGVTSPLRDVAISGSRFSATIGGLPVNGTFVKRVRDGVTSFGLLVHDADIKIDTVTVNQLFCRRVLA